MIRRFVSILVLAGLLLHSYVAANACGPSYLQPLFVFEGSPDLPFQEFAAGKIGIVKPTFGRKTLLIAYRYLNGGSFSADEQKELVEALEGKAPEDDGQAALKQWLAARKEYLHEEELPDIYAERRLPFGRYDFFPNCAGNAFEVATTTLRDRVARFGADDPNVREWVRGQDEVFQNCSGSANAPQEVGPGAPVWLRKDRAYQIAAALFYSLQLDQARARFHQIAEDDDSDWQTTADYLVARTLVREASLTEDAKRKTDLYLEAEGVLQKLGARGNQFRKGSQKLMALVKYRFHPEERIGELAAQLAHNNVPEDLRQNVIDYVWLLDKFEGKILEAEHQRLETLKEKRPGDESETRSPGSETCEAIQRGELISITFTAKFADGTYDYRSFISVQVKPDTRESEIIQLLEQKANRQLLPDEVVEVKNQIKSALDYRAWQVSQNRKLDGVASNYEGCYECYDLKLSLRDVPAFLIADDLTDWILTFQIEGPETYDRAVAKWRETESPAWLLAALTKAETTSPRVGQLMQAAERVAPDSAAYPTITFQLIRLRIAQGKSFEAQQQLDNILATRFESLPVSAQNQFRAERLQLSKDVNQFLKFAARKPVGFLDEGLYRTIHDLVESKKTWWSPEQFEESKEDYEKGLEREYQYLLSDDLTLLDDSTADVLDRHFSLQMLAQAAVDPSLSAYLRRRLTLVVWTRAIMLKDDEIAMKMAPEVIKVSPELAALMSQYLQAGNATERAHAALFLLLRFPGMTPYVAGNLTEFLSAEESDYYLESAWWCRPSDTEYRDGKEVPKVVAAPAFLDRNQLQLANREFAALAEIGDAKSYLGKEVIEWARKFPNDARVPEALFIAAKANESYKYGCSGWANDTETKEQAATLLRERYPESSWATRLEKSNDQ